MTKKAIKTNKRKPKTSHSVNKTNKRQPKISKPQKVKPNRPSKNDSDNLDSQVNISNNSKSENKILWEISKMQKGQFLSETCYYKVESFNKNEANIVDHKIYKITVTLNILDGMISATHFNQEVPMSMTALAEVLEQCKDDVFTCCFHKKATVETVKDIINNTNYSDLKHTNKVNSLVNDLLSGNLCTMTCHLVDVENNLGRSTVIDLNAPYGKQFRQIDHRSIEWIILKNVKYYLKNKSEKSGEMIENKKDVSLWDNSKLEIGNWFSSTTYYEILGWNKDEVFLKDSNGEDFEISQKILESSTYNSSLYETEEKVTLTEIGKIFKDAKSKVFTVCYNIKVDVKEVKDLLSKVTKEEFQNSKDFAKTILTGSEKITVGRLYESEAKLGRSLVLSLPNNHFASVDHRTIKWLIIKNVKYVVK